MSTSCSYTNPAHGAEPVEVLAIEVRNKAGHWVRGYELLSFDSDGMVTVRSNRTQAVRRLHCDRWRDSIEVGIDECHGPKR